MPRSPTDATRFTSTGPYVATKPTGFTSNQSAAPSFTSPGGQIKFGEAPAGERPEQKIARLRAAAQLANRKNETAFDKSVRVGRVWADKAHRVTAISLIGLTILSGAVATAGITDMLLHNRRRRNEWLAEKQAESARELAIARHAQAQGRATEEQVLLINRERAADEAELARKNRPGMFKRASSWLFSGLSPEEQKGGKLGAAHGGATEGVVGDAKEAYSSFVEEGKSAIQAVEDKVDSYRRGGELVPGIETQAGGPLDRRAQSAADAAVSQARSWTSWITGR